MKLLLLNISFIFFLTYSLSAQVIETISVSRESKALVKGKVVTELSECYYSSSNLKMVVHSTTPDEYIKTETSKGELSIYFPGNNKLLLQQNSYLSSTKEELYIYVNNMYDDLGLRNEGFSMIETRYEEDYMIIDWAPPSSHKGMIMKIEIVYENLMPVYSATYNVNGDVYKKTYYSDYITKNNIVIPERITDITYTSKTDSIVRRVLYSNIKINDEVDKTFLNFKVPDDAILIK